MKETTTATEGHDAFERWLRGAHAPAHARRTAAVNAAFLMPHLRPGMRLLDCGCGPGSITIGLAQAIAPGEAAGIDLNGDAVTDARTRALDAGCSNVRFYVADVLRLPFLDAQFDVVFAHAVLQHVPDPLAAVREMRRVLKPGGVLALADADHDGSIIWPQDALIDRATGVLAAIRQRGGGGDPRIGKRLRGLLDEAGFPRTEASATAGTQGTADAARLTGEFWAQYIASPQVARRAAQFELATAEELQAMASAWRRWGEHPGAFWAAFWCQAIGWK